WHSGCIGETTAALLLVGGVYLVLRKVINPVIPVSFIGTVFVLYLIGGASLHSSLISILSGGLMLGAIFMATDYTTSPTTNLGKLIFGIGCGVLTFVIRRFANLPEGVSYSILLMNILTPHINSLTLAKPFGAKEAAKNG
ncbi:MAG: RnfABCDGE type electron transport complex subunit D, partial [Clostridia bacterium]|nr:RnfABCDGE type electron transport complex subunit D [Clostridia bacterium]